MTHYVIREYRTDWGVHAQDSRLDFGDKGEAWDEFADRVRETVLDGMDVKVRNYPYSIGLLARGVRSNGTSFTLRAENRE